VCGAPVACGRESGAAAAAFTFKIKDGVRVMISSMAPTILCFAKRMRVRSFAVELTVYADYVKRGIAGGCNLIFLVSSEMLLR
jgi:hypothetical protein